MTRDVYLVFLEFGRTHEQAALDLLASTLRRACPGATLRAVVVDNALGGNEQYALGSVCHRVSGDNLLREFSGWDRGLGWLEQRYAPAPESIVVLANDTVVRPEKHDRVRDLPADRLGAAAGGALVGWVDEYPRAVTLCGLAFRQWVDTSLVLSNWRTLAALGPLARALTDDAIFGEDWRNIFRDPSPLSDNYRAYLKTYFFGDRIDQDFQHAWYAQAPLTEDNFEAFKTKLRCVLCEHLLSACARAHDIPLVDIRSRPRPIDSRDVTAVDAFRASY
jgi:hypothetical protein